MRIGCDKFAKRLLEKCGCNENCYRGIEFEEIEKDLKQCFADNPEYNYNNYPIHDIAVCLRQIGDAVPLPPPKMWKVIWDGGSFVDGRECETFEEAKNEALETLVLWQCERITEMGVKSYDGWTDEQIENWDYMIDECSCHVEKKEEDEWVDYWWPSEEDEKTVGWMPYNLLNKLWKEGMQMEFNTWENAFKEVIEDASHWVSGDKDLEIIHWNGNEDCDGGWYAYEYDGDQSIPIYANDYDRKPLISDETIEKYDVDVVKVFDACNVAWCG